MMNDGHELDSGLKLKAKVAQQPIENEETVVDSESVVDLEKGERSAAGRQEEVPAGKESEEYGQRGPTAEPRDEDQQ